MSIAPKLAHLRTMTDEELIEAYDEAATHADVGTSFYLDELSRRRLDRLVVRMAGLLEETGRQIEEMLDLNKKMTAMTVDIRWLTVVAAAAAIFSVIIAIYVLVR